MLFTNDGDLSKKLTHPSHKVKKIYSVTLDKKVVDSDIIKIKNGIKIDGEIIPVDNI